MQTSWLTSIYPLIVIKWMFLICTAESRCCTMHSRHFLLFARLRQLNSITERLAKTSESSLSLNLCLIQQLLRLIDLTRQIWTAPSVRMVQQHDLSMPLPQFLLRQSSFRHLEYQCSFLASHLLLEATLVEGLAEGVKGGGVAPAAEGDDTGAA